MFTKNIVIVVALAALVGVVWFALSGLGLFDSGQPRATYNNADKDMIVVDNVTPGVTVLPSFKVFGKARGTWYFEASFPVEVVSQDGKQIAIGHAQADGNWMTEDFVPFSADVQLTESYSGPATLILHNDNPSGDPSRDRSLEIPIVVLKIEE